MKIKRILIMFAVFVTAFSVSVAFSGCEKPVTYTIIFDAGGGTVEPATKVVIFHEQVGELPIPEKEGYTFSHWELRLNGQTIVFKAETVYDYRADETLIAVYTEDNGNTEDGGNVEKYNVTIVLTNEVDGVEITVADGGYKGKLSFSATKGDYLKGYMTYVDSNKILNQAYDFLCWAFINKDGKEIELSLKDARFEESIFGNETDITIKAKYAPTEEVWTPWF